MGDCSLPPVSGYKSSKSHVRATFVYVTSQSTLLPVTMPQTIGEALGLVARELSDKNYAQSLDFYRFWCGTGQTYLQIPSDQIFDAIWDNRTARSSINGDCGQLIHSTAHLTVRFASDVESDHILAPYTSGLQTRLCARSLQKFSSDNLMTAQYGRSVDESKLYTDANLIAHWANRGYVEEAAIRNHVTHFSSKTVRSPGGCAYHPVQTGRCHI